MSDAPRFRLVLAKEDCRFSIAHFTVFSDERAELLHGHNYQVAVAIEGPEVSELGLLADVERLKTELRRLCAELDSRTVIPGANPHLRWERRDGSVEVRYRDRRYLFPEADALVLPLANSSMELFARHLWERLSPGLAGRGLDRLTVSVEESAGQRAEYERTL